MKNFGILGLVVLLYACGSSDATGGGDALFENEKYAEAIEVYTTYLGTNPNDAKTLYNRGRAYEELGQVAKAKADFNQILESDPKYVNAYLGLAKLSYNESNYPSVLSFTGKAIELNENSAQAHFLSARAAHQLGYTDQALESYNNAISINKDFGEAFLYRGALKIGTDKPRSACEDFNFARLLEVEGAEAAIKQYCK